MRLIEAGKILDNLSGMLKSMDDYDAVKKVINDMPTAYDPDKVVEQLQKRLPFCPTNQTDTRVEYELLEAIEIVKGGGVDGN